MKEFKSLKLEVIKITLRSALCALHSKKGFSLIEIMVAMGLLVILSTIGLTSYNQARINTRDARRKQDLRAVSTAVELFKQSTGKYPCSSGGWQTSADAVWLSDNCTATVTNLKPNYINNNTTDPKKNSATPWSDNGYGYYSPTTDLGTCKAGFYYILVTQLENTKDPEANSIKKYTACGITYPMQLGGATFGANSFVVVNP